jgi:hypothetical protein
MDNSPKTNGIVWRTVPSTLRPKVRYKENDSNSLFLIREQWRIEVVTLNSMRQFDLENSEIKNPNFWAYA